MAASASCARARGVAGPGEGRPMIQAMTREARCGPWLLLAILLGGCATQQERVAAREDELAAAGFVARPADTPQRDAMLQRLVPYRILVRASGRRLVYLYADPLVCGCLYVGSEAAYDRHRRWMLRRQLAEDGQLDAGPTWSFGVWGGPWGPDFSPDDGSGPR